MTQIKRKYLKPKNKTKKKYARAGKILSSVLYCYVEPDNFTYAKSKGKEHGTASSYVNYLISKDRGVKPATSIKE